MTLVTTQPGAGPTSSGQMSQTERSEKSFKDLNSILWSGTRFSKLMTTKENWKTCHQTRLQALFYLVFIIFQLVFLLYHEFDNFAKGANDLVSIL